MSDWGGTQTAETTPDPNAQALQALRLKLVQGIMSGDWSQMQGFFDKILIPNTKNTLTAAGLGRSGAIGEAVSNAQLSYAGDFIKSLLTGIPTGSTQTSTYEPGIVDWLGMGLGFAGSLMGSGAVGGRK